MKRYFVNHYGELEENADGDLVRYDDIKHPPEAGSLKEALEVVF